MGITAMGYVWKKSTAKGSELLLLLAIADLIPDDKGYTEPSKSYLAHKARISFGHVKKLLDALVERNELTIEIQGGQNTKSGRTNRYSLPEKFIEGVSRRIPLTWQGVSRRIPHGVSPMIPINQRVNQSIKKISANTTLESILSYQKLNAMLIIAQRFSGVRLWQAMARIQLYKAALIALIRVQQIAKFWQAFWNDLAEWALVNTDPAAARKRTYQYAVDERLASVFYDKDFVSITDEAQGVIRKAGLSLRKVGIRLDQIQPLYNWCFRQGWNGTFTPRALAKHFDSWHKADKARANRQRRKERRVGNKIAVDKPVLTGPGVSPEQIAKDIAMLKKGKEYHD